MMVNLVEFIKPNLNVMKIKKDYFNYIVNLKI